MSVTSAWWKVQLYRRAVGQKKKSESLADLFKVFGVLKQRYGKVHVSFAEPIFLDDLLNQHDPDWREISRSEKKPPWLNPLVDELGQQIMTGMNEATHVNAINLLAVILLTTRKLAMGREELLDQLELTSTCSKHAAILTGSLTPKIGQ